MRLWRRVVVVGLVAGVAVAAAGVAGASALRTYSTKGTIPLRTSLFDPYSFVGTTSAFTVAYDAGASYVRLPFHWSSVAPTVRPVGFVPSDPTGYSWDGLDNMVAAAEAAGLTPLLDIISAPKWAYAVRPHGSRAGMPDPAALASFSHALAAHFDGVNGPEVHAYQVWNEPNNSLDLSPVKASRYRDMVNAVATGVHAVDLNNLVIAGGLDPFENQAPRFVSQAPLAFMRSMLCISKGEHPHATCKAKVHFDVWSHHPYTFGGPFGHAKRTDDISLGDLPKMRALLRTAVRLHRIVSPRPVQFWVTEFSWDTKPPRAHAAPVALQARWTAESMYQMWRSGVSLVTWFLLQDRGGQSPYQSGLYYHAKTLAKARAKPTLTAFRFPFVAYLATGKVRVWGRDGTSSKALVTIQRRRGGSWRSVARIRSNRYGIFKATLKLNATKKDWMRATAPGSGKSLAFSLSVPKVKSYGPWGN